MILKNYRKILAAFLATSEGALGIPIKDATGTEYDLYANGFKTNYGAVYNNLGYCMTKPITNFSEAGVVFGDGAEPVTLDDYTLSGNIITTISPSVTYSHISDDNGITTTAVYTLVNTGSTAITVREIGLIVYSYRGKSSNYPMYVMADRTLLDTPIAIEPNGVGQVTYTIRQEW